MRLKVEVDLDDIYTDAEWGTTVASEIKDQVRNALSIEARKYVKELMQTPQVKRAIQAAKNSIDIKELEQEAKSALIAAKKKHFQKELERLERMR